MMSRPFEYLILFNLIFEYQQGYIFLLLMAKVNCDEEPLKELRRAVIKKHGKIYSVLKEEVNRALSERAKKILKEINGGGS